MNAKIVSNRHYRTLDDDGSLTYGGKRYHKSWFLPVPTTGPLAALAPDWTHCHPNGNALDIIWFDPDMPNRYRIGWVLDGARHLPVTVA